MDKLTLIYGQTCMPCHQVIDWCKENNIEITTWLANEHMDFCIKNNIRTVPTLVITNEDGSTEFISNADPIKEYLSKML